MIVVERCSHCGLRVVYGLDGRCPQCREHRESPVTDAHRARAAEIRAELKTRPVTQEKDRRRRWRRRALASIAFGIFVGGSGILISAASFRMGHPTLWWGLMLIGGWSLVVGVARLFHVPKGTDPD